MIQLRLRRGEATIRWRGEDQVERRRSDGDAKIRWRGSSLVDRLEKLIDQMLTRWRLDQENYHTSRARVVILDATDGLISLSICSELFREELIQAKF